MIDIITMGFRKSNDKTNSFLFLSNYFVMPLRSGLRGFIVSFSFLEIAKLISYLFGSIHQFSLYINDIILPLLGFLLVFMIKFLENFNSEPSKINKRLSENRSATSRLL